MEFTLENVKEYVKEKEEYFFERVEKCEGLFGEDSNKAVVARARWSVLYKFSKEFGLE